MTQENPPTRREFVKKAVITTGIVGGALGSAQPVAAADQTLRVYGYNGGDYLLYVNDSSAYGGTDLESGDAVTNYSSKSKFEGYVGSGDTDTLHFTGQITGMSLKGDLEVSVDNPNGINRYGDLTVEGSNNDYYVEVTDALTKTSDCESDDDVSGNGVNGHLDWSDTDTYNGDGTIQYVTVWPSNSVTINHNI